MSNHISSVASNLSSHIRHQSRASAMLKRRLFSFAVDVFFSYFFSAWSPRSLEHHVQTDDPTGDKKMANNYTQAEMEWSVVLNIGLLLRVEIQLQRDWRLCRGDYTSAAVDWPATHTVDFSIPRAGLISKHGTHMRRVPGWKGAPNDMWPRFWALGFFFVILPPKIT